MTELVEEEIMGEDLDYEEYDLDEEEEEALLAENEGEDILSKMEPIEISIRQDETHYAQASSIDHSVQYHLDEEEDAIIEEEEDDDDYDSKSRDRFKSERTKVSLSEPTKRNIPDSLDDVKTTEIVQGNQRKTFNKRGRYMRGKNRNFNNRGRMQPYRNVQNFNNWEGQPLMSMPPQIQQRYNPMINMYHPFHGPPINMPPSPFGPPIMMQPARNPYMVNSPQIPRTNLKQSFGESNAVSRVNSTRKSNKLPKENIKQSPQNRSVASNPNLTVINTVELPAAKQAMPIKVEKKTENKVASLKMLTPEEEEYQVKLEEQKRKREEILAKKEMRRKEAAKKAQATVAPVTKMPSNRIKKAKESMLQKKTQRIQLLREVHERLEDNSNVAMLPRNQASNLRHEAMPASQQSSFSLLNLVRPPVTNPPYNPPVDMSVPPPRLAQSSQPYRAQRVVTRPLGIQQVVGRSTVAQHMARPPGGQHMDRPPGAAQHMVRPPGTPQFLPPPGLPQHHTRPLISQQQPTYSGNFNPYRPPPMAVSQPVYTASSANPPHFTPNIPPPVNPQYNHAIPHQRSEAPTITLNFPPPPINRIIPQAPATYYQEEEESSESYIDAEYNNQYNDSPTTNFMPRDRTPIHSQAGPYSEKYKWNNQQDNLRSVSSGSNIIIKTSNKYEAQPIKKIKRFKRIIRKNKDGDVLLIKKLVIDDDGNPTGDEEIEFIHPDIIARKKAVKKLVVADVKREEELVQERSKISNKHFRGADNIPINRMGEGIRKTTYSKLSPSEPGKRIVTTIMKRPIRPVRCSSSTVMLTRIPSNVTVNELKGLTDDEGLESPKSILYDKAEKKCAFEFAKQTIAFKFCKKMNGRMLKMSIIHADIV